MSTYNVSHPRRRTRDELTSQSSSVARTGEIQVPPLADNDDDGDAVKIGSIIFRSNIARMALATFSVALLLTSLLGSFAARDGAAANIKLLSDKVMNLTRQLQSAAGAGVDDDSSVRLRELEELRRQVSDKEVELSWERQHVHDEQEKMGLMKDSMLDQIKRDRQIIEQDAMETSQIAMKNHRMEAELYKEKNENANLKVALAQALEELARARDELPNAPPALAAGMNVGGGRESGEGEEGTIGNTRRHKLRATNYQPGDNIEIIEYQEGGMIALRPGIVTDVNNDGTFNLVKLEASILLMHISRDMFQTYQVYPPGTQALFETSRELYVPVTIVRFLRNSARERFELHGTYEIMFGSDGRGNKPGLVQEGSAMRIHRYTRPGEVVGLAQ